MPLFTKKYSHCIIYMKNNYRQIFVVVCLMTYIHVRFSTLIEHLYKRLYNTYINTYIALNINRC